MQVRRKGVVFIDWEPQRESSEGQFSVDGPKYYWFQPGSFRHVKSKVGRPHGSRHWDLDLRGLHFLVLHILGEASSAIGHEVWFVA